MTSGRPDDGKTSAAPRDMTPESLDSDVSGAAVTGADIDPAPPQETAGDDEVASEASSFSAADESISGGIIRGDGSPARTTAPSPTTDRTGRNTDRATGDRVAAEQREETAENEREAAGRSIGEDPSSFGSPNPVGSDAGTTSGSNSGPTTGSSSGSTADSDPDSLSGTSPGSASGSGSTRGHGSEASEVSGEEAITPADQLRVAAEALTSQTGVPTTLPGTHDDDVRIVPVGGSRTTDADQRTSVAGGLSDQDNDLVSGSTDRLSSGSGESGQPTGETLAGAAADVAADIRRKLNAATEQLHDVVNAADVDQHLANEDADRVRSATSDRGETASEGTESVSERTAALTETLRDATADADQKVAGAVGATQDDMAAGRESSASASGAVATAADATRQAVSRTTGVVRDALPDNAGDRAKSVLTAGGTPRTQRLIAGIVLVGTTSGFARWAIRRLGGPDIALLGPSRIRPAVLGIGFAALAASLYVDDDRD